MVKIWFQMLHFLLWYLFAVILAFEVAPIVGWLIVIFSIWVVGYGIMSALKEEQITQTDQSKKQVSKPKKSSKS